MVLLHFLSCCSSYSYKFQYIQCYGSSSSAPFNNRPYSHFNTSNVMVLLFQLLSLSTYAKDFNTSNVMVLLLNWSCIQSPYYYFNTSNVMVLQNRFAVCYLGEKISIHPMLWFFSIVDPVHTLPFQFQYIQCYGSSYTKSIVQVLFFNFNTSNVMVLRHITFGYLFCSLISIHPMLWFFHILSLGTVK